MTRCLVKVENVSKKFCRDLKRSLWYGVKDIGAELVGAHQNGQLRKKEFWAVNDVSFELKRGECLGLIGHNGAGKSTLLKMLNGLIKPDKGSITMKGRIGALIELGAGFNPILTGRENIYNNGAVLGFSKKEIDQKFDAIVDFAEIDEFIDTPVQNYSSGMKVRLGFAVAAQMEPDVLIIDEVLAVGDLGFRVKCLNRINELLQSTAVIFVSHSMPMVARLCSMGILMKNGKSLLFTADIGEVINHYNDEFGVGGIIVSGSGEVIVENPQVLNRSNRIEFGKELNVKFEIHQKIPFDELHIRAVIWNMDQRPVLDMIDSSFNDFSINPSSMKSIVELKIQNLLLAAGKHTISFHVFDKNRKALCRVDNAISFVMGQRLTTGAECFQIAQWTEMNNTEV